MAINTCTCGNSRRVILRQGAATVATLFGLGVGGRAQAQAMIEALRIFSVSAPGSAPDSVARRVAEQLNGRYAKSVIVENRPGAAGRIAVNAVKLAPADGSTLLLAGIGAAALNPLLHATLGYDPVVDLQPVSMAAEMPMALAVGPAVPDSVGGLRDFFDWMQRNPKLANGGSPGVGSLPHLLEALLFRQANVSWQHVSFSGGPPTVAALLGGQIAVVILPDAALRPHRLAGKLRVLATSGAQRSAVMPDVPTFVELGYRELIAMEWFGFFMSGRVPQAAVEAASRAIREAVARPELASAFAALGMAAVSSTPAELAARIASEKRIWEAVIRVNGIRAE
jgi:tripartite-type tricarboxylate transporter receptor subunit TctC